MHCACKIFAVDSPEPASSVELIEGIDFYREGDAIVFTEAYHRRRGYCCESGCRHCPYDFQKRPRDEEN
jgi:hypothetical protein